ncbi:MAG: NRDE family protein, partial [Pseudomonadales bacterium]|nr:NRDE family protein [Pseudomonadales bacterium]
MCLIVFSYQPSADYPFILVANRDEFYARASASMGFWQDQPGILAGRDLEKSGTWLGLHLDGRFAAVTNHRRVTANTTSAKLSRGQLVNAALLNPHAAEHFIDSVQATAQQYGGYNLLTGDCSGLFFSSNRSGNSDLLQKQKLVPGIYGLCNGSLDTPWPKLVAAKHQLSELISDSNISSDTLRLLLTDTEFADDPLLPDTGISKEWERSLSAQFIQLENYGTRAKTIILQDLTGSTKVIEIRYNRDGFVGESSFEIQLPVFASDHTADSEKCTID